jgi:hypothetical protein
MGVDGRTVIKMTMVMVMVFAVLFFAAGPGPARSRGNDDTREEAAGKTRRVSSDACQIRRGIDRRSGNWVFEAGGFPGAVSGPRRGLDKTLFFPVRDLR